MDMKTRFLTTEPDRNNSLAFYISRPCIGCVRVSNVVIDSWGVKLTVTRLPVPGLSPVGWERGEFHGLSGAWECFTALNGKWSARYTGWEVHFNPAIVAAMTDFAAEAAARNESLNYPAARTLIERAARERREQRVVAPNLAPPSAEGS